MKLLKYMRIGLLSIISIIRIYISRYNKEIMISIIYLLNNKKIKYGHIILLSIIILIANYINPYLLAFCIIDIYALLSITQFKVIQPSYATDDRGLKMNITTEGIQRDEHDVKSIFLNYMSKFK